MRSSVVLLTISVMMLFLSSGLVASTVHTENRAVAASPQIGGNLNVAMGQDPGFFAPLVTETLPNYVFDDSIWSKLLTLNTNEQIVGDLAQSWTQSSNLESFVFNLNPKAMWTDGVPVTSVDVKWTLFAAKNSSTTFGHALATLVSVETPDAHTVIVNFSSATNAFIFANYPSSNVILPAHIYNNTNLKTNPANNKPIGDGPFIMTNYVKGQSISLEANPNYFGGRPYLNNVTVEIIPSLTTAIAELQAKQIDLLFGPTYAANPSAITTLQHSKGIITQLVGGEAPFRISFNNRTQAVQQYPFLANVKFRQAIAYAINDTAIISAVLNDTVAPTSFYATDQGIYDPNLPTYPYNPTLAKQLLDQVGLPAGANGVRLSITLPYYNNFGTPQAAAAIQQMLAQVGIVVNIVTADQASFLSTYWEGPNGFGTYPIVLVGGATGPNPIAAETLYDSKFYPALNGGNTSIGAVDQLFNEVQSTTNQSLIKQDYYNIQQLLAQYLPSIPLYTAYHVFAAQSDVQGMSSFAPFTYEFQGLTQLWIGQSSTQTSQSSLVSSSSTATGSSVSSNTTTSSSSSSTGGSSVLTEELGIVAVIIIVIAIGGFFALRRRGSK